MLGNIHGSGVMHPKKESIRKKRQEVCVDDKELLNKLIHRNEIYRE